MVMEPAIHELALARSARKNNKEGQARVLARRSAGLAIREYLAKRNIDTPHLSLNDLVKDAEIRQHLPRSLDLSLDHLCTRVDAHYALPADLDLIRDTEIVIQQLS